MILSSIFFILGLYASLWISKKVTHLSLFIVLAHYSYHTGFSLLYCWLSFQRTLDSTTYYKYAFQEPVAFDIGTQFIIWIISTLSILQPTYIAIFMLFQLMGFIGIWLIVLAVEEDIYRLHSNNFLKRYSPKTIKLILLVFLFTPGMNFWTVAIGKDSLIILGIGMCFYSIVQIRKRVFWSLIGVTLIFLIRPYVCIIIIISLLLSLLFTNTLKWYIKLLLMGIAAILIYPILEFVLAYVGLSNPTAIWEYIQYRQTLNVGGSYIDLTGQSLISIIIGYLIRPLFFDAHNGLMVAASFENVIYVIILVIILARLLWFRINLQGLLIKFSMIYFIGLLIPLALVTANLGLAVRQKTMLAPALFYIFLYTYLYSGKWRIRIYKRTSTIKPKPTELVREGYR